MSWPTTPAELERAQDRLARARPEPWSPPPARSGEEPPLVAACAVVFGRGGAEHFGWAGASVHFCQREIAGASGAAPVHAPFEPGLLALREGPILERVVRALPVRPDVLLVAAAGRDHPRGAGLALHLGAALDLPTIGVTDDPLLAEGDEPERAWMSRAPLRLGGEVVGYRVRTRTGSKPIVAHAAWRTSPEVAAEVALGATALARWPEPLREARRIARELRAENPYRRAS